MTTPSERPNDANRWAKTAEARGCYCGLWDTDPEHFKQSGLSPGYCGQCDRCGAPGHTRHFPGPVPYTGAWCDRCYRIVQWTWLLRSPQGWTTIAVGIGVLWGLWPLLQKMFT